MSGENYTGVAKGDREKVLVDDGDRVPRLRHAEDGIPKRIIEIVTNLQDRFQRRAREDLFLEITVGA